MKKKFLEKGFKFKFISEPDRGISDAFNKGTALATGDLVGIINSDDWLENDALKVIAKNYDSNYSLYCGDLKLWEKGKLIAQRRSRPYMLWLGMYVMHPTVFVKRDVYDKYRFDLNHKIAMDFDFLTRVTKNKKYRIKYIPETLANMETGGASSNVIEMLKEEKKVIKENSSNFQFLLIMMIKKIIEQIRKY